MREVYNNIVYDPEFYTNEWPNIDFPAYLYIEENLSEGRFRTAHLIKCDSVTDREFITTDHDIDPENIIGRVIWYEPENSNTYYFVGLVVSDEYQNYGVGYFLAGSIRGFFGPQGIAVKAPPPSPDQRQSLYVENIISRLCITYQDDIDEFLADDGNYYFYSEWVKKD